MYTLDYMSSLGSYVYSMVKGLLDVATCIMVGSDYVISCKVGIHCHTLWAHVRL